MANRSGGRTRPRQGFSLLELLLVLALLTLFLGLVAPNFFRGWENFRTKSTLRQMAATLRSARSLAVLEHRRVRVLVDLNLASFRLEGATRGHHWPGHLRLLEAHLVWEEPTARRGYIAFYGDGSSSGGYLALQEASGRRHFLDVEIITGKVTWRTGGG